METHPFYKYRREDCSEAYSYNQLMEMVTKIDFGSMRRKTPQEKLELKNRMVNYPNKRHCPVPPNN
jgi:hypothetical protein